MIPKKSGILKSAAEIMNILNPVQCMTMSWKFKMISLKPR